MKHLILVTVALFIVATSSCNQSVKKSTTADSTATASGESITTYTGTLPCADCSGIFTKLTLTVPENGKGAFRMTETYQGTKNGDQDFNSQGNYSIAKSSDGNTVIITLNPDKDKNLQRYFQQVSDAELRVLDGEQNVIQSNLNYSLKKQ